VTGPPDRHGSSCRARPALSAGEERVLQRMRELKARFRSLRDADADPAELAELRREFATCREALREANRDKWIALGYEVDP